MSLFHRLDFRGQHPSLALLAVVLLLSLILPTLGIAPLRAMQPTLPSPSPTGFSDPREVESFLDGVFSMQLRDNHIPGAVVAVVKDGRLFLAKGYGEADLQEGRAVIAQTTVFRIGSVAKLFTATAVLQLVEQGKLNLHADLNTSLKTFHIPATYPQPITLAHLLTHTAGFEDQIAGYDTPTASDLEPLGQWLAQHIPARVRPPGELTAYSNYGYALAGYIVEQVSGQPYAHYVQLHLFQPLGMRSSTFLQPVPASVSADLSLSYTYTNGLYRPDPFEASQPFPSGSMSSTATDMANFMLAQLQNGRLGTERILQAATAQAMQPQQFTNDPRVPGMAYGLQEQNLNGERLLVKSGHSPPSFNALLALLPEQHVGLFVAYNSIGGLSAGPALLQAFLDHYFPAPNATLPPPPDEFAQRISQISGDYWSTRRNSTTYEKLATLSSTLRVTNGGNGRLVIGQTTYAEVAPWVFHQVDGPETVVFRSDHNGMLLLRGNDPTEAFTTVAWHDAATLHLVLVVASLLLFLSALLLWPLGFVRRVMRRGASSAKVGRKAERKGAQIPLADEQGKHPLPRREALSILTSWLAGLLCAVNVLLPIALVLVISNPLSLLLAMPPLLTTVFVLAFVSVVLTVGVVVSAILTWWGRFWNVGRRIHYTLVALAALAFAWELLYWNLLVLRA